MFKVEEANLMEAIVLTCREILERIRSSKPLIQGYVDLEKQLQPAGFELTVSEIMKFKGRGRIGFENSERRLPEFQKIKLSKRRFSRLPRGAYLVRYNEEIWLPADILAIILPRSSLLRCGVVLYTAVWDPGYHGKGQGLLNVYNPHGFELKLNSRIGQMIFFKLSRPAVKVYRGIYQREGLS
jgi:dUTP pyrophosphatase